MLVKPPKNKPERTAKPKSERIKLPREKRRNIPRRQPRLKPLPRHRDRARRKLLPCLPPGPSPPPEKPRESKAIIISPSPRLRLCPSRLTSSSASPNCSANTAPTNSPPSNTTRNAPRFWQSHRQGLKLQASKPQGSIGKSSKRRHPRSTETS